MEERLPHFEATLEEDTCAPDTFAGLFESRHDFADLTRCLTHLWSDSNGYTPCTNSLPNFTYRIKVAS